MSINIGHSSVQVTADEMSTLAERGSCSGAASADLLSKLMDTHRPTPTTVKGLGLVAASQMQISALPSFASRASGHLRCACRPVSSRWQGAAPAQRPWGCRVHEMPYGPAVPHGLGC